MSDVTAVKEAIEYVQELLDSSPRYGSSQANMQKALDAARSYVRMIERSWEKRWCVAHGRTYIDEDSALRCNLGTWQTCKPVPALVVPLSATDSEETE